MDLVVSLTASAAFMQIKFISETREGFVLGEECDHINQAIDKCHTADNVHTLPLDTWTFSLLTQSANGGYG